MFRLGYAWNLAEPASPHLPVLSSVAPVLAEPVLYTAPKRGTQKQAALETIGTSCAIQTDHAFE